MSAELDGGFRHGLSAVRVRPGSAVDPYSQEGEPDWETATSVPLTRISVAPVSSDEVDGPNGRWVESSHALYSLNYSLDVRRGDRIEFGGVTYDVTGEGARWQNPHSGRKAGAVFGLKAIT